MLKGLRTVKLDVSDLAAARDWYARVLGHPAYFDQPFYVGFDVGGYELGLTPKGDDDASGDLAYWAVDDVPTALARLVEAGATLLADAQDVGEGIVVGAVRDPFGHPLGVIRNPEFAPPLVSTRAGDVSDRAIVKEVVVPAPPAEVWSLWTSPEGMAKWWLPNTRIDLRPGGHFELYFLMDAPPGGRGSEGCRVLSYLPGRMLSFTWNAPPHLPETRFQYTWVVLELAAEGEGTRARLTHLGWPGAAWDLPGSQWPETFAYFDRAWGAVMELLAKHLAT